MVSSFSVWEATPGPSPLLLTYLKKNKTPLIAYQKPSFLCIAPGQINISIPQGSGGGGQISPSCQHFYPTPSLGLYLFHSSAPVLAHSIHWIPIWRRMWSRGHAIWTNLIGCQLQSDRHSTAVPCGYAQWHWLPPVVRPTRSLGRWEGRGVANLRLPLSLSISISLNDQLRGRLANELWQVLQKKESFSLISPASQSPFKRLDGMT